MIFAAKKNKKGQLTIEYLILSVVVLAILAVSITTVLEINKSAGKALNAIVFRKSALDLYSTIEEVCALGAGNSQTVLLRANMTVTKNGKNIEFSDGTNNMALEAVCPLNIDASNPLHDFVNVTNERYLGNEIKIKITNK